MEIYNYGVVLSFIATIIATYFAKIRLNVFLFLAIGLMSYIGAILILGVLFLVMADDEPRDK